MIGAATTVPRPRLDLSEFLPDDLGDLGDLQKAMPGIGAAWPMPSPRR